MTTLKEKIGKVHKKTVMPFLDLILGRTMSKKLMVFFLATIFVYNDILDGDQWVTVAQWYFGAQGAVDIAEAVRGKYKHTPNGDIDI
jgi:hypothetical protein